MKKLKLKSLLEWLPRSTFKASYGSQNGKYPFFVSSKTQNKWIDTAVYDDNCLIFGTGGNASIHHYNGAFSTSTDCIVTKINSLQSEINTKYIFYYLKGNISLLEKGFKGVAIKHISKNYLENIEIDIPSLDKQNQIVTILDKVEIILKKREQNISNFQKLINSLFLDKFGEQIKDIEKYDNFNDAFHDVDTGWSPVCEKYSKSKEDEIAVLKQSAVSKGFFDVIENKVLPKNTIVKKKCYIQKDDLLFSRKNTLDYVGSTAFVFDDIENLLMPDTIFNLRYRKDKVSGVYLYYLFNDLNFKSNIKELATGALVSMSNISKKKLLELKLPIPDLIKQQQFDKEVRIIIKKINNQRKSFSYLESLLKSLTQRLFIGQSNINIELELEAIINAINLQLPDGENKIDIIKNDLAFRQKLIDKLAIQEFSDLDQYDKAKYIAFRLLKEKSNKITQEFDSNKNKIILS